MIRPKVGFALEVSYLLKLNITNKKKKKLEKQMSCSNIYTFKCLISYGMLSQNWVPELSKEILYTQVTEYMHKLLYIITIHNHFMKKEKIIL